MWTNSRVTLRMPRWLVVVLVALWLIPMATLIDTNLLAKTKTKRPAASSSPRPRGPFAFEDVTRRRGLAIEATPTWGSAWADTDRDGMPELLVGRHKRSAMLMTSTSGRFEELPTGDLLQHPDGRTYYDRHTCSWGEADGDGAPDLMCVSGAQKGEGTGPNMLLEGRAMTDVAEAVGVVDLYGRGRSVNWLDHDSDGDLDLFIGNEARAGYPSHLYRNDGGRFTAVVSPVSTGLATTDSNWGDFDRDGDPDLLILGHGELGSRLYRNDAGTFAEMAVPEITGAEWESGAWGDFDGDGWIDLHLVTESRAIALRNAHGRFVVKDDRTLVAGRSSAWLDVDNDGDLDLFIVQGAIRSGSLDEENQEDLLLVFDGGRFTTPEAVDVAGYTIGNGESLSVSDFDRDGRVDVLVANGYLDSRGPLQLLRNVGAETGNHAALIIRGPRDNPFAYGARLRVLTSQGSYWRFLTDAMSFHSQSEVGYVPLGLGRAERARIRFVWPNGTVDCYQIDANETLEIVPSASTC